MIIAVAIAVLFLLSLIVFSIIIHWKVYEKAGQPGWAVLIPLYNILIFLQIVNKPWWWLLLLCIPLVNVVLIIILVHRLSRSFGKDGGFTIGLFLLNFIFMAILAFDNSTYTKLED
jgi:hypothetical protein